MSAPLVSIIIPCYNAERYVAATLRSALSQTWLHREIIVVDDGSTDSSPHLVSSFADHAVRLVSQKNAGASAARNRGLREARGTYIQYLDADDLLAPDKIEHQVSALERNPGWLAACPWGRFYDNEQEAYFGKGSIPDGLKPVEFLTWLYAETRMIHPAAWLLPRDVADRAGPWDESLSLDDDGEYFARVVLSARGVLVVNESESYYRSGITTSLSRKRSRTHWLSQWRSVDLSNQALIRSSNLETVTQVVLGRYQRMYAELLEGQPELADEALMRIRELGGSPLDADTRTAGRLIQLGRRGLRRVVRGIRGTGHPHRNDSARQYYRPIRGNK